MFFKKKYDGIIEAVRYNPDGLLVQARVYERIGSTFTDRLLLSRQELVERIKSGKRFMIGQRKPFLAGSFETGAEVRLNSKAGKLWLSTSIDSTEERDMLQGAPLF
ncbi:MAG: hypothetical protein HPY45_05195 [Anaerolineae bacterium]|nr:hypothetical protein [Anaerolineae bacterium]